ncbi:MAG: hypothetical protein JXR94_01150, partial [Candidatus Hydrogenedentes bacterium]|nr:hypothetical protein [Candidatus Hydrogenedentota bacterium]
MALVVVAWACAMPAAAADAGATDADDASDGDAFKEERDRMVEYDVGGAKWGRTPVTDRKVLDAMRAVPRHEFVPGRKGAYAYADSPLPIGYGQTISQPYIV